jgi:small-conductance mechanosensitive channel
MSTFAGLPAHPLLVHFVVVLALLTAVLGVLCAVWPAARQRLVWLTLALAVVTTVLVPFTTESGEWLEHHIEKSELVEKHAELGDTMIYFALALLVAAVLIAVQHVRAARDRALSGALAAAIAVFAVLAGVATTVQVYRIGDSGAHSVWADALSGKPAATADDDGK